MEEKRVVKHYSVAEIVNIIKTPIDKETWPLKEEVMRRYPLIVHYIKEDPLFLLTLDINGMTGMKFNRALKEVLGFQEKVEEETSNSSNQKKESEKEEVETIDKNIETIEDENVNEIDVLVGEESKQEEQKEEQKPKTKLKPKLKTKSKVVKKEEPSKEEKELTIDSIFDD